MPYISYTPSALRDFQRLREFLKLKNLAAAKKMGEKIKKNLKILTAQPHIGRPILNMKENYREWLIDFGDSGYVVRYYYDEEADIVNILAIWHQKESGI